MVNKINKTVSVIDNTFLKTHRNNFLSPGTEPVKVAIKIFSVLSQSISLIISLSFFISSLLNFSSFIIKESSDAGELPN